MKTHKLRPSAFYRSGSESSNIVGHMNVRSNVPRSHCVLSEHLVVYRSTVTVSYSKAIKGITSLYFLHLRSLRAELHTAFWWGH